MALTIRLPQTFDITATNRFVRSVVDPSGDPMDTDITLDFEALNFIDGSGYTVLSNTIGWLSKHRVICRFLNFDRPMSPAIQYLDDCGFFLRYIRSKLDAAATARKTTLPCTLVAHAQAFGWLERTFSPWMCDILRVGHDGLASVRTCVKEIFHNINDHSTHDTGYIHVQHYPNIRQVRITISDFGTGIPTTIRSRFGDMDDGSAILMATQEGVTAKSRPNNMGAGLNYLIDRVMASDGTVRILSLTGTLYCFRDRGGTVRRRPGVGNGVYPGTLVDIALDTRLFVGDEEERGEVEW